MLYTCSSWCKVHQKQYMIVLFYVSQYNYFRSWELYVLHVCSLVWKVENMVFTILKSNNVSFVTLHIKIIYHFRYDYINPGSEQKKITKKKKTRNKSKNQWKFDNKWKMLAFDKDILNIRINYIQSELQKRAKKMGNEIDNSIDFNVVVMNMN